MTRFRRGRSRLLFVAMLGLALAGVHAPTPARAAPLDDRVALMARELDLSADQQSKLKAVLLGQREQLLALWNDTSIPAALRVGRTQVLADRTADQIRALLSEEQRKKYIQPRKRTVQVGTPGADIAAWSPQEKSP